MNPALRVVVAALAVVLFVISTIVVLLPDRAGDPAMGVSPMFRGADRLVVSVAPGGAAERAGLRAGDILDYGALNPSELAVLRWGLAGNTVDVPASRDGRTFVAHVTYRGRQAPLPLWARTLTILMDFVCVGLVIVIVRGAADRVDGRLLLGFVVSDLANNVYFQQFAVNGSWAVAGYFMVKLSVTFLWLYLLKFLIAVPHRESNLQRVLARLVAPAMFLFVIFNLWNWGTGFRPAIDLPLAQSSFALRAFWAYQLVFNLLIFAAVFDGIAHSGKQQRVQMQWIGSTVVFSVAVESLRAVFYATQGSSPAWLENSAFPLESVMVLGVGYAVLKHRLIDMEFVFSRAAVFTIVSAVLVIVFLVFEWLVANLGDEFFRFAQLGPGVDRYAGLAGAMAAGLLARPVHAFVDKVLNQIFFARQRRDEEALRRFSREAEVATDHDELIAAAFEIARKHVETSFVAIFARDGVGYRCLHCTHSSRPGIIAENDPIALRLRRFGEAFELDDTEHEYHHAVFFPMTVLGRLVAFIICGPKPDRTHYTDSELETLSLFAQRVGTAYAWLNETAVVGKKPMAV